MPDVIPPFLRTRLLAASPTAPILAPERVETLVLRYRSYLERGIATRQYDASNDSPVEVRAWLRSLAIPDDTKIDLLWLQDGAGGQLSMADLIAHVDTLWMPSADDVWVVAADDSWSLFIDHEEHLSYAAKAVA